MCQTPVCAVSWHMMTGEKCRSRPVSRVLSRRKSGGGAHSSRTRVAARLQRAQPGGSGGPPLTRRERRVASLFALAPGGVCHAAPVTGGAVRSCRTVSPLPRAPLGAVRRSVLCGTFLRVAPTGRWPAPCPVVPGLSSAAFRPTRTPGRLQRMGCNTRRGRRQCAGSPGGSADERRWRNGSLAWRCARRTARRVCTPHERCDLARGRVGAA